MILRSLALFVLLFPYTGFAQGHVHHVKHNMVLYGEFETFASHIVFKAPHNYQVILKVDLPPPVRDAYLKARRQFPANEFIYLLDEMHIADVASLPAIKGTVFHRDGAGKKTVIAEGVTVPRARYQIIFFNELPL